MCNQDGSEDEYAVGEHVIFFRYATPRRTAITSLRPAISPSFRPARTGMH